MTDSNKKYKILFEASKLYQSGQDGVKRYTTELLKELSLQIKNNNIIEIDLLLGKHIIPLYQFFIENELGKVGKRGSVITNDMNLFKEGIIMNLLFYYFRSPFKFLKQKAFNFYYSRYYAVMLTMLTRLRKGKYPDLISKIETYDLIHVGLPQNILFFEKVSGRFITTLHDISHVKFPEYHTKDNINRSEKGMKLSLGKKSNFIAVSQSTKSDVIDEYGVDKNRIKTIHEGVNLNIFYPKDEKDNFSELNKKYQLKNKRYFLSIGTLEPRKNLTKTIQSFLDLEKEVNEEIYLIIIGGKGWRNKEIKRQLNIESDKIIFLGFVPDEHLRYFYIHALALVYPSFYEGFGLPLLESMACGIPVIYGDNSAMPEVVLQGGLAVNADDTKTIKEALDKLLNKELKKELGEEAFNRALELTWDETAKNTLDYYQFLLS